MKMDPIIFDPKVGCLYARFSIRRYLWKVALDVSLSLMIASEWLPSKVYDLGEWLLETPFFWVGDFLLDNAWRFGLSFPDTLFAYAYPRSGEEKLDALNDAIPFEHLSAEMREVVWNWDNHVTLLLENGGAQ